MRFTVCGAPLIVAAFLVLPFAGPGFARPDTRAMSCDQARALVQKSGRITITTGANLFGEVFATSGNCRGRMSQRKTATTRDNPKCQIGYVCLPFSGGDH